MAVRYSTAAVKNRLYICRKRDRRRLSGGLFSNDVCHAITGCFSSRITDLYLDFVSPIILDSGSRSAGTIKANVISWSFSKRLKENRELISGCTLTVMENSKGWVVTSLGSIWTSKGSSALLPANGIARVNRSEKPVTNNLLEAEHLISIADAKSLIFQIGHTERFNPAVLELDTLINKPIFIEAHRMGHPTTRNLDIGVVLELMIHDINIILSIVNSTIVQINAVGLSVYSQHEDIAQAQLLFENGCIASISASRVSAEKIRSLEITQDDAFLHLDYIDQNIILRKQVSSRYVFDQPRAMYQREFMVQQPLISKDEPLRLELQHFIECVRTGAAPLVSGRDGKDALAVALQIRNEMVMTCSKENKLARDLLVMEK